MSTLSTAVLFVIAGTISQPSRFNEPSIGVKIIDYKAGLETARKTANPPTNGGVFVVDVVPYVPAAKQLSPYDLIMYANGDKIESAVAFEALVKKSAGDTLILTVCRRMSDSGKKYEDVERVHVAVSTLGKLLTKASKIGSADDGDRPVTMPDVLPLAPLGIRFSVNASGDVSSAYLVCRRISDTRIKPRRVELARGTKRTAISKAESVVESDLLSTGEFCELCLTPLTAADLKMLADIVTGEPAKLVFVGANGEDSIDLKDEARQALRAHLDLYEFFKSR